jgi:hypothetical protein
LRTAQAGRGWLSIGTTSRHQCRGRSRLDFGEQGVAPVSRQVQNSLPVAPALSTHERVQKFFAAFFKKAAFASIFPRINFRPAVS